MDKTDSHDEEKMENLDARLNAFDDRFSKLEATLNKFIQSQASGSSPTKRHRESDEESNSEEDSRGKAKKAKTSASVKETEEEAESSDGEIHDDDEDVISLEECSDDDLLKEIDNDLDNKEKTSAKVADSMAEIINKRFTQGLNDNKLKERLDKYTRPENCTGLQVPRVNREIWRDLPTAVKQSDVKMTAIQRAITKATAALAQSTQEVLKAHKSKKFSDKEAKAKITDNNADAMALLGHASHELSIRRRQAIRPHLPKHMRGLCGESVPITSQLFGDNLTASIKEIKELNKLSLSAGPSHSYNSGYSSGYRKKQWPKGKDRRPFLGQRSFGGNPKKNKPARQTYQQRK